MPEREPIYLRKGEPVSKGALIGLDEKRLPKNVKLELTIHDTWTPQVSEAATLAAKKFPHTILSIEIRHKNEVPRELIDELLNVAKSYHYTQYNSYKQINVYPEIGHAVEEYREKDGTHVVRLTLKGLFVSTATIGAISQIIEKYRDKLEKQ